MNSSPNPLVSGDDIQDGHKSIDNEGISGVDPAILRAFYALQEAFPGSVLMDVVGVDPVDLTSETA